MIYVQPGRVLSAATPTPATPSQAMPIGRWQSDLFDMTGAPGGKDRCVYTHLCFPCAAGDVARRTGGSYCLDCAIGGTLGMVYAFAGCLWGATRTQLRLQHNIPGSTLEDFCVTTLLPCCYLSQALNHLDIVDAARAPLPISGAPKR